MRIGRAAAVLVAALLVAAGCGGDEEATDTAAAPGAIKINIASFKYLPVKARVAPGATITWVNQDKAPHTSTSTETDLFDTGRLDLEDSKAVKAPMEPGTYRYYCIFHRFMEADVEVVAAG